MTSTDGLRLTVNMPSSGVKKPGKPKARKVAVSKKTENAVEDIAENLNKFSFSNEENPVLRLKGGGAQDSDSDETGKTDDETGKSVGETGKNGAEDTADEAKEENKEAEKGMLEVGRMLVSDKSGEKTACMLPSGQEGYGEGECPHGKAGCEN